MHNANLKASKILAGEGAFRPLAGIPDRNRPPRNGARESAFFAGRGFLLLDCGPPPRPRSRPRFARAFFGFLPHAGGFLKRNPGKRHRRQPRRAIEAHKQAQASRGRKHVPPIWSVSSIQVSSGRSIMSNHGSVVPLGRLRGCCYVYLPQVRAVAQNLDGSLGLVGTHL